MDNNNKKYKPGNIFLHKGTGERVIILRELDRDEHGDRGIPGRKFLVRAGDYSRLTMFDMELTAAPLEQEEVGITKSAGTVETTNPPMETI